MLPRDSHAAPLVSWTLDHGATLHPAVEVYHDATTGLSIRVKPGAAAAVSPSEAIVSIPSRLSLSYLNALGNLPEAFTSLRPHVVGRFFLIQQHLLGKDSFWFPYIQALPQPSDRDAWELPPFWPEDDAELLDGTNVEVAIQKIRQDVRSEFNEARQVLSRLNHRLADINPSLYHWAYCIFSSRSFRPSLVLSEPPLPQGVKVDDFSVLLPLFDIGNHDMTASVNWVSQHETCALHVDRSHHPGEQVFNNYSMKTNAELLLGYGFMIPASEQLHNDYTHVRKRTGTPEASEEYYISLRPMNDASSLLGRSKQTIDAPSVLSSFRHVQHDMVWDIFCTLADPSKRQGLTPERVVTGDVDGELREALQQTAAVIQHKVLQELERLNETDVEVDDDQRADLTRNQRLALDYREACRGVLESTLEAIAGDETFD